MRAAQLGRSLLIAAAVVGGAIAPNAVAAQDLEDGTWTGTVTPPDGQVIDVSYEIATVDGVLTGTLVLPPEIGAPPMSLDNLRVENGSVLFEWSPPGTLLVCELESEEDGTYQGPCFDSDGEPGFLTMVPPA